MLSNLYNGFWTQLILGYRYSVFLLVLVFASLYPALEATRTYFFLAVFLLLVPISFLGFINLSFRNKLFFILIFIVLLVYFFMSFLGFMGGSWTYYYEDSGAVYQFLCYVSLLFFILYFSKEFGFIFSFSDLFVVFCLFVLSFLSFVSGNVYEYNYERYGYTYSNMNTMEIFRQFFVFLLLWRSRNLFWVVFYVFLSFFLMVSSQHYLLMFVFVFFLLFYRFVSYRLVYFGFVFLAFVPFISAGFYEYLFYVDHNFGVRAVFWKDALSAVQETSFLGVGFGTESIFNEYWLDGRFWTFRQDFEEMYSVSVHNGFVQMLFRLGVFAGVFILWLYWIVRENLSRNYVEPVIGFLLCALFLSVSTNVAFSSPNFLIGSAFVIGAVLFTLSERRFT